MAFVPPPDPVAHHYPDTRLVFPDLPGTSLDVRLAPDPAALARVAAGGVPVPFAVVTPCNPFGRRVADRDNAERLRRFEAELAQLGVAWTPCTGEALDRSHAEPGAAVALPLGAARALGRAWEQTALFWVTADRVTIVPCHGAEPGSG